VTKTRKTKRKKPPLDIGVEMKTLMAFGQLFGAGLVTTLVDGKHVETLMLQAGEERFSTSSMDEAKDWLSAKQGLPGPEADELVRAAKGIEICEIPDASCDAPMLMGKMKEARRDLNVLLDIAERQHALVDHVLSDDGPAQATEQAEHDRLMVRRLKKNWGD